MFILEVVLQTWWSDMECCTNVCDVLIYIQVSNMSGNSNADTPTV